jgi:uncharacterized protein YndB with AHSA1/START domain
MRRSWIVCAILAFVTMGRGASVEPVVTDGIVNAPVEEVWKAFTTKQGIESWMVAKTEFELRVGATWRTSYSKDSNLNDDASIHHTILAYDPGRMLAFRTIKTPRNFPFPNALPKTWNVVYFESAGPGRTKVTTHMLGYEDNEESQKMRAFFEAGNKTTMDSLIKRFQ